MYGRSQDNNNNSDGVKAKSPDYTFEAITNTIILLSIHFCACFRLGIFTLFVRLKDCGWPRTVKLTKLRYFAVENDECGKNTHFNDLLYKHIS